MIRRQKRNRRKKETPRGRIFLLALVGLGATGVGAASVLRSGETVELSPPPITSAIDGEAEQGPPTPPPPAPLPVRVEARSADGDILHFVEGEVEALVPAEVTFWLESETAFTDLRVRLFDEAGRLVPAEEEVEVGLGTKYFLRPAEPLDTGTSHRLLIEGQEGRHPLDVSHSMYLPADFVFKTEGEKPERRKRRR